MDQQEGTGAMRQKEFAEIGRPYRGLSIKRWIRGTFAVDEGRRTVLFTVYYSIIHLFVLLSSSAGN